MWRNIRWTDEARDHVAKHGITPAEVSRAVWSRSYVRRTREGFLLIGRANGRLIFVVLREAADEPGVCEPVTARDATSSEKHLWRRRGKWFQ